MRGRWSVGNGRLVGEDGVVDDGVVVVEGEKIAYAGPRSRGPEPGAAPDVDAAGGWICPGFIDVHVHGGGGADVMDGDAAALATIGRSHVRHGTTAWLATTMTGPRERLLETVRVVGRAVRSGSSARRAARRPARRGKSASGEGSRPPSDGKAGARLLGLHLEGPYINPRRAGAQNPAHMGPPRLAELERLDEAAAGAWRLITLAPELPGALEAIGFLTRRGVAVSLGHSAADDGQARRAAAAGAVSVTHVFNAMDGLHHRRPGLLGEALDNPALKTELIADGVHVHPLAMRLLYKLKGAAGIVLVTDSTRAQGMGDGDYDLGGVPVVVRDGVVRLRSGDSGKLGPLAGSVLTMDAAVRRMVQDAGAPVEDAVRMASYNPAALVGWQDRKGTLAKGYDADVVVLDAALHVRTVIVEGCVVHRREWGDRSWTS